MNFPRILTRTAVRAENVLLRAPLRSIDRVVVPLLGENSLAHRSLVRGVQTLDAVVDRLAGEPPVTQTSPPGGATEERTEANERVDERTDVAERVDERTEIDERVDERTEIAERAEHYLETQEGDVFVGELADENLRRAQAEVRAKQEIEDEHSR